MYADAVAVALDEERGRAVCLYSDRTLIAWDVRAEKPFKVFEQRFHSDSVYEIDVSEDEKKRMRVISGASDKTLRDWTVETAASPPQVKGVTLNRVHYSCDGFEHMKANPQLKGDECKCVRAKRNVVGKIRSVKRSIYKDVPHLLAADQAGFVWVYNEKSGNIEDIFDVHASEITSMNMSPICEKGDARSCLLVTTSRDHRVKIFKMDEGYEEVADLGDH